MGVVQCDDGNIQSGDGCSSDCKIEEDFRCKDGNYNNSDICLETIPPFIASFRQTNGHKELLVTFSEFVKFKGSTKYIFNYYFFLVPKPMDALQIIITGPASNYDFQIDEMTFTNENWTIMELKLNLHPLSILYGEEVTI